jgi:predicted nuclease of restriction endonuclease-like (RecB) superfamily
MSELIDNSTIETLFEKISSLISNAQQKIASTVNLTMVYTYFGIGRIIIENEQDGNIRAAYGKQVLQKLSDRLNTNFGKGYSVDNLENMRQFFLTFSKSETVSRISNAEISETLSRKFFLSWSHYLILMRVKNQMERDFYEKEALNSQWSVRELQRQYNSSLFERLALSRDKTEVLRLAEEGHVVEKSTDILKNPLTLAFLGMDEKSVYSENELETAIISKLQYFLLELGKGFLFEARQKRFTFDEEHFYVDLVFYNRLLQCYVLLDLKNDKLVHQDLGQMQMYVNYYDRYMKLAHEKPTIGILLCKEKKDTLVELTLPKDANIYAAEYSLYLPDKTLLQNRLNEWIAEFENEKEQHE